MAVATAMLLLPGHVVTAAGQNTQVATVTTEHTLLDVAAPGLFTLHVDTNAMIKGDVLELRVYQIVLASGTRRVVFYGLYGGSQLTDDKIKVSDPVGNELSDAGSLRFTLKQTFGTSGSFPWKVLKYTT